MSAATLAGAGEAGLVPAHEVGFVPAQEAATPIHLVTPATLEGALAGLPEAARAWAAVHGYEAKPGRHLVLPGRDGSLGGVLFGVEPEGRGARDPFLPARLVAMLPPGPYRFAPGTLGQAGYDPALAALGWLTGSYRFRRYKAGQDREAEPALPRLVAPEGVDAAEAERVAAAVALGRDLINTPASDLGPEELEAAARALADRHGAGISSIVGESLLAQGFPMIHAVGRASPRAPRLVDLTWGDPSHPKVTLVGKGVVFDTGGLNLKPDTAMLLMKKDMGGAASVLACAAMVMGAGLSVRLRVLLPIVENAVSGSSYRPGDVLASRKGISVEIGNTDAEGRLILADALALADEEAPDLLVDMSTLTGAARVALGPELPALFTHDDALAASLERHGLGQGDPLWRMPLWDPYRAMLESRVADISHISGGPFAGSVTAALFLDRFVTRAGAHAHFDMFCWIPVARPGRPEGGEVMAARALYAHLRERFGGGDDSA